MYLFICGIFDEATITPACKESNEKFVDEVRGLTYGIFQTFSGKNEEA
jgi:hypothetical protein